MKYEIGVRIRQYRKLRGMSQKELAGLLGISSSRLSNWEQGINRPDADTLLPLCLALQVSADELLDMDTTAMQLSIEEKQIILQYRAKPNLQEAVRILLGLEK